MIFCATWTVIGQTSYIVVNNHHTVSRTRYRDSFRSIATRVVTILPLGNRTSKVYHRLSVNGSTKYHAISPLLWIESKSPLRTASIYHIVCITVDGFRPSSTINPESKIVLRSVVSDLSIYPAYICNANLARSVFPLYPYIQRRPVSDVGNQGLIDYAFNEAFHFTGTMGIFFLPTGLNGNAEANQQIAKLGAPESGYITTSGSTVDLGNHYVFNTLSAVEAGTVLPVRLFGSTAKKENGMALLQWSTSS